VHLVYVTILLSLVLSGSVHATELWRDVHPDKEYLFETDETDVAADISETEAVTKATDWATRFYGDFRCEPIRFWLITFDQTNEKQPVYAIVLPRRNNR
jgi:hypothetical protein